MMIKSIFMKKLIICTVVGVAVLSTVVVTMYKQEIDRLAFVGTLFSGAEQYENFNRIKELIPVSTLIAANKPFNFEEGKRISLPEGFVYEGQTVATEDFLSTTDTSALLIIHKGNVRFEDYMLTGGRDVNWLSMSVAKSFVATSIGIAVDEGLIDIQKAITDYVPSLKGSAYDNVRIKDVLQMSSGAAWNEDYSNPESDVLRLGKIMATGGSLDEFIASMKREKEPGTFNHYNSADTQALGMLLVNATGKTITEYMQEKIWTPLGMESDAYWMKDDHGMEMAFAGMNATARDYAKLGELYRLKGNWQGKQIVSAQWVHESVTPDAQHLMPNVHEEFPLGYGYQWWVPDSTEGEYSAIGVYNQFIYVNPSRDLVIVKLSANSDYAKENKEEYTREIETIEFFRAIGRQFGVAQDLALSKAN
jgi:CubicO group peptidase (beta-lactamase class C family)